MDSAILLSSAVAISANAAQVDIPGPPGSSGFGRHVAVLPNGNIVVTDPGWNAGAGAVYLYSPTGVRISTLTGSLSTNQVGGGGVTVLANGNFVIRSDQWDDGSISNVGAVTWGSGSTGVSGFVSAANSLIGTTLDDAVGLGEVTALSNGNYVVTTQFWNNGSTADVGAVTWANGNSGLSGTVSPANSLIGTTAGDQVGSNGVTELGNGNYVLRSTGWDNGVIPDVGAVTWANGSTGFSGVVSPSNSLIGGTLGDQVGRDGITALSNGNYVVASPVWDNNGIADVGAATWADGSIGLSGPVSSANSLIGTTTGDRVGSSDGTVGVTALSNGNYVVRSTFWDNGTVANVGAVTWANGALGRFGAVTASNSLIGISANDFVGVGGVTALRNGHYVVPSPVWNRATIADAGAVTWANGNTGLTGSVLLSNSLVGPTAGDRVGSGGVVALSNGNYVVSSPGWDGSGVDLGAVTWADGSSVRTGGVTSTNSLVGTTLNDRVGEGRITALSNGNYVVSSPDWDGGATNVGAVTWGNGSTGRTGMVSSVNSLIGTSLNDRVGEFGVSALANGNYVVLSPRWDNGIVGPNVGAVTWANGSTGLAGLVLPANSLIGTSNSDQFGFGGDQVGSGGAGAAGTGDYFVLSPLYNSGTVDAGAITLARGDTGLTGTILPVNSVLGTVASFAYDAARAQMVVGRSGNIVSLFALPPDLIYANGFE